MKNSEEILSDTQFVNIESVETVKDQIIPDEEIFEMSELFKVFSDSTRLKIISSLLIEELCVGDIAHILNISVSACSHQLRVLKNTRLVKTRREGKLIYYSLKDEHISLLTKIAREHVLE